MAGVYLSSLLVIVSSVVLGSAITSLCREERPTWMAGAVGNATLLVAATLAIRLPAASFVAPLLLLVLVAGAAAWAVRARGASAFPSPTPAVLVAAIPLALIALPFLAAGHFGPLGVGLDDDLGFHVAWVQQLHAGHPPFALTNTYPIGMESLAAVFPGLAGGGEQALVGIGAGALGLTALTALTALDRVPWLVRVLGAGAVAVPYLTVAYFGEGSFKEAEMGMLVLAFALLVVHDERPPRVSRARQAVPAALLVPGMFVTFGAVALVYPAGIVAARAIVNLVRQREPRQARPASVRDGSARAAAVLAACALVVAVVYVTVPKHGLYGLFVSSRHVGGNLIRALPLTEAAGAWPAADFRLPLAASFSATALVAIVLVALVAGVAAAIRRRDYALLVPAAVVVLIALASRLLVLPYESAKTLVIGGPLIVLFAIDSLARRTRSSSPLWGAAGLLAACVVSGAVLFSAVHVLWASPVDTGAFEAQLAAIQPLVSGRTVLFLGRDDWAQVSLPGARIVFAEPYGAQLHAPMALRAQKSPQGPFDFDSEPPGGLDRVSFVVTTATLDASSAPPNFRVVYRTPDYLLWARRGRTPAREVLAEGAQPGAFLDCKVPALAALAARGGVAAIRPPPVAAAYWRSASGATALRDPTSGYAFAPPGGRLTSSVTLGPGTWQLSLDYQSPTALRMAVGADVVRLPSRLEPIGSLWPVVDLRSTSETLQVRLDVIRHRVPAAAQGTLVGPLMAVRRDTADRLLPLPRSCGRYVDWYRLGG